MSGIGLYHIRYGCHCTVSKDHHAANPELSQEKRDSGTCASYKEHNTMKKFKTFKSFYIIGLGVIMLCAGGQAAEFDPVLGKWKVVTQMGTRNSESMMEFSLGEDGALKGLASSRQGSLALNEVTFDGKMLSWKLTIQGNIIPVSVEMDGDKFAGAAVSPLGSLPVTGSRFNEAEANANLERLEKLIGDWEVTTEFNGATTESKLRIFRDEDDEDIMGMVLMLGSRTTIHEFHLEGDQLLWNIGIPFISTQPAGVVTTLNAEGTAFDGVVKTAVGEIPIHAKFVDTSKLVESPYDDPALLVGTWQVTTTINETEEHASTITFVNTPEKLIATIESEGTTYEASAVDYHLVNEKLGMASARVHVTIPELRAEEMVFEMVISGEGFEGEELYSDGTILISGTKAK